MTICSSQCTVCFKIIKGKTEGRVDIRSRAGLSKYSCQLIETSISLSVNSFFSVLSII